MDSGWVLLSQLSGLSFCHLISNDKKISFVYVYCDPG